MRERMLSGSTSSPVCCLTTRTALHGVAADVARTLCRDTGDHCVGERVAEVTATQLIDRSRGARAGRNACRMRAPITDHRLSVLRAHAPGANPRTDKAGHRAG